MFFVRLYGCAVAILKERSPACGAGEIYDGSFTHTLTGGFGVAAELLEKSGIRVLGESQLYEFLRECVYTPSHRKRTDTVAVPARFLLKKGKPIFFGTILVFF